MSKPYEFDDDVAKTDRNNRQIVIKKMYKYVENDMNPEKAAAIIANNPKVKAAFKYLTDAGIDLKDLFVELYTRDVARELERQNDDKINESVVK